MFKVSQYLLNGDRKFFLLNTKIKFCILPMLCENIAFWTFH